VQSVQRQAASQGGNETRSLERRLRLAFWLAGFVLATMQAWAYRHYISADGISYLDMSDAVFPGVDWHRIITGTWSPFYPFLLGLCRLLSPDPYREVIIGHLFNIPIFLCAFAAFEFFFRSVAPEQLDSAGENVFLPRWMYLVVAYTCSCGQRLGRSPCGVCVQTCSWPLFYFWLSGSFTASGDGQRPGPHTSFWGQL